MFVLSNPVRDYAWGSRARLAAFLGREPSGDPEAELWIGAHEGDPSLLPDGTRLDEAIAADPGGMLGSRVHHEHGARLPFLMKVLAVDQPLSLQVHPGSERARLGFGREERAGVPLGAAHRSYKDPWHKPELIYALTRFEGMAGFRDVERTAVLLELLGHSWADEVAARLVSGHPTQALHAVASEILAMSSTEAGTVIADVVASARDAAERGHARARVRRHERHDDVVRREAVRLFELFPTLAGRYPEDPGVLVTLLLNHVVLAPGEAMYVGAGVVHAYASGFGVEIMAASDNVLRAGLTPKHRDVTELLSVTDFTPMPSPRWEAVAEGGSRRFETPVPDFALSIETAPSVLRGDDGPRLLLALDDGVSVLAGDTEAPPTTLARGQCLFVPGRVDEVGLEGAGRVAVGRVPT